MNQEEIANTHGACHDQRGDALDRGLGAPLGREPQEGAAANEDPARSVRDVRAPEGDCEALPDVRGPVERPIPICIRCSKGDHKRCVVRFGIFRAGEKRSHMVLCPCWCRGEFMRRTG